MELKSTIGFMLSKDCKERFIGEYLQVKIRYEKLMDIILKEKKYDCSKELLLKQARIMNDYINVLIERAKIEGISLEFKEQDLKGFIDSCIDIYKEKTFDWWSFNDFKEFLKSKYEKIFGKELDLRTAIGRQVLAYARDKWENE